MEQETRSPRATLQSPVGTGRSDEDLLKEAYRLIRILRSELNWRRPTWARRFLKGMQTWMDAYRQNRPSDSDLETQNQARGVESNVETIPEAKR